jgi:hypothetical protein
VRNVAIWFVVTVLVSIGTVLAIFKGISLVMDFFLKDDRFYEGIVFSVVVSACGTLVLFVIIFIFVRRVGRFPRKKLKGITQL